MTVIKFRSRDAAVRAHHALIEALRDAKFTVVTWSTATPKQVTVALLTQVGR